MAKMKRITISFFLALIMCFSFSSIFTVKADELSSDDWEQISLDLQQGGEQSGEDFNFIKDNNGKSDDGEWILYLGIGLVVIGILGITYAVLSSKRQRAIARKRRDDYIRNLNAQNRRRTNAAQQSRPRTRQQSSVRPQQSQSQRRPSSSSSGNTRRAYDESNQYNSYDYIKGSRYVDGGVRRTNSRVPQDSYNDGYGSDGYGNYSQQGNRMPDDDMKTYTRKPSQPRKSPGYEDISSFSSSDRDIYSSSSRRKSKYINDYIDYE